VRPLSQSTHRPTRRPGNYCPLVSLCLLRLCCMRLPLSMSPTALTVMATESCAEYRLRLRGNYRDKDMPRYDLNIEIFDTIRYIVPSLHVPQWMHEETKNSRRLGKMVNDGCRHFGPMTVQTGMTNYRIGSHRTASNHIETCLTLYADKRS